MQLVRKLLFILLIGSIGCTSKKEVNKEIFWQSVFNYFADKHFVLEMPPPPLPNSQQEQKFRRLCNNAVIHTSNDKIEYPKNQLEEIEKFLSHSVTEQMYNNISEEDFLSVDIPISFQNFNELSREEKFFTKKQQCGVSINAPIIYKNKAILVMGIMYNPKAVADYLLFLEYSPPKKEWKVIKQEILGFS